MSTKDDARKKKKLEIKAAKIGVECFNSFYYFFKTFWKEMSSEEYHDNWHIEEICNTLQEKGMKLVNLEDIMETIIINIPPGSSKSTIATIAFPLWIWLRKPNFTTTNISYSATLSKKHAHISRGITDSARFHILFDNIFEKKHGKKLEISKQNELEILNNFKGSRFNTSVGGTITGMHANIIIEDDPLNPEEAFSDASRKTAIRFHDETVSTRLKNFKSYLNIIIAQRLHEKDTCGHVLGQNIPITQICLPGELTKNTIVLPEKCRALYIDGVMDNERKPQIVLDQLKIKLGKAYTGQVLQMPFNLEDQDITPDMFQIIDAVADNIVFDVWIDSAYTEKTENDPTGIDIITRIGNDIVVKESYSVRKKLPDLLRFIIELENNGVFDKDKSRIFIEAKASGHSLADYIEKDTDYNFVRIGEHNKQEKQLVAGGKKARHTIIQPKAESHRIKLVKGNWNEEFIVEICGFPRAANDERVDNLGYAVHHYFMNENAFIEQYALDRLEKRATGSINIDLTSQIQGTKVSTSYQENDSGDVMLFDNPNLLYRYRYICILALRGEGERTGNTSIVILDRQNLTVPAMFLSDTISEKKAALKALEMAHMYDKAKIVVAVEKNQGQVHNEEYDLSNIAIQELRKVRYENIYFRLKTNDIRKKRERQYGFEVNQSSAREIYYNLKDMAETNKVKELPLEIFEEMKLLERKKDTGFVTAKEGHTVNAVMAYSVGLKVDSEMQDKVIVKRSDKWN